MPTLEEDGIEIHRGVFTAEEIESLRDEANRVTCRSGSACARNIRGKSPTFDALSSSPKLLSLLPSKLMAVRSILFDKTPEANWLVAWHQDLTISVAEEVPCDEFGPWSIKDGVPHVQAPVGLLNRMVTARIHLDPTGKDNGALSVVPGSHLRGKLTSESITRLSNESSITCECQPGDVLLMSPLILHSSKRSTVPNRRRILHFEYAPPDALDSRLTWNETPSQYSADH